MNKIRFTLFALAVLTLTLFVSSNTQAQATRTWVSGVGDDANPCSRTAPCKTYAGAISKTAKDGEISTLDPGGFGAVTITKSITINGGGAGQGYGSILASGTNGVIINITDAADLRKTVRLDWLNINGASTGLNAIRFLAGAALFVENTLIDGFTTNGIDVNTTGNPFLFVKNTTIRNCAGSGISATATGSNSTSVSIDSVSISKCGTGFNAQNGTRGTVRNSQFGLNSTAGIVATQGAGAVEVNVDTSVFTGHPTAITTNANTKVRIARCTISQNTNALGLGGTVDTGGNNTIMGNGTNQAPNGTLFAQN